MASCRKIATYEACLVRNRTDASLACLRLAASWFGVSVPELTGDDPSPKLERARMIAVRLMDFSQVGGRVTAKLMNRRNSARQHDLGRWRTIADRDRTDPMVELASQVGEELGVAADRARNAQQLAAYYTRKAATGPRPAIKPEAASPHAAKPPSSSAMADLARAMAEEIRAASGHSRQAR